jgi:hypothetical protein
VTKKNAKSNKTQPDPDCISFSAHSAYTIYSNGKLGESKRKQKGFFIFNFCHYFAVSLQAQNTQLPAV